MHSTNLTIYSKHIKFLQINKGMYMNKHKEMLDLRGTQEIKQY